MTEAATNLNALADTAGLDDEARALIKPDQGPQQFIPALAGAGHFPAAIRVLAHLLPAGDAIAWAHSCARKTPPANPKEADAIAGIEQWLEKPDDEKRRRVMELGNAAGLGTPAGCIAMAIFFSGGSVSPPHAPDVPPVEYAWAKGVSGAVIMAGIQNEPEKAPQKFRSFVDEGYALAERLKIWEPPAEKLAKG